MKARTSQPWTTYGLSQETGPIARAITFEYFVLLRGLSARRIARSRPEGVIFGLSVTNESTTGARSFTTTSEMSDAVLVMASIAP